MPAGHYSVNVDLPLYPEIFVERIKNPLDTILSP
jgi:hypothetical protein